MLLTLIACLLLYVYRAVPSSHRVMFAHACRAVANYVILVVVTMLANWIVLIDPGSELNLSQQAHVEPLELLVTLGLSWFAAAILIHHWAPSRSWSHLLGAGLLVLVSTAPSANQNWHVQMMFAGCLIAGGTVSSAFSVGKKDGTATFPSESMHALSDGPISTVRGIATAVGGFALCLVLVGSLAFVIDKQGKHQFPGGPAPEIDAATLDGQTWRLSDHRGKIVLLEFWATRCQACVAAIPEMRQIYDTYGHRDDFVMVGVALDGDRDKLESFCSRHDVDWAQLFDPSTTLQGSAASSAFGIFALPSVWIIDKDGNILGANLRGSSISTSIERALARTDGTISATVSPATRPKLPPTLGRPPAQLSRSGSAGALP